MRSWIQRRILTPIREALLNGLSQKKLAISLSLGIILGLIPFYGITTILVGVLAYALRLDFVVMQVVHYVVHPLQIALIIPFLKAGSFFSSNHEVSLTIKEYIALFKADFWNALVDLWKLNLLGIMVWLLISIPLGYGLYRVFVYSIKRYSHLLIRKPAYISQ